jgi:hypothetical protein
MQLKQKKLEQEYWQEYGVSFLICLGVLYCVHAVKHGP